MNFKDAILHNARGLALFALLTAGLIGLTQYLTRDRIANNIATFEARQLQDLLPAGLPEQPILEQRLSLQGLAGVERLHQGPEPFIWRAFDERRQVSALIFPVVAPNGYTEAIGLLVAIDPQGQILGVRVTRHRETPGLGDAIESNKSDWLEQFVAKSLSNPETQGWAVRKDGGQFDALTGATITPRAVVRAVHASLTFYQDHQRQLLIP